MFQDTRNLSPTIFVNIFLNQDQLEYRSIFSDRVLWLFVSISTVINSFTYKHDITKLYVENYDDVSELNNNFFL